MKKIFTLILMMAVVGMASAQPWTYDFGTSTGTHTTNTTVLSSDVSPYFPVPTSGIAMTRIGTGGGSWNLENPGSSLGSGSELRGVAPTGGSVNKFSVYDYTAGKTFALRFRIRFDGGSSGIWYLFNGDGTTFSGTGGFTGSHCFVGLRFTYGASSVITPNYRSTSTWTVWPSNPLSQANNYLIEIYGNNSTVSENYTYGGAQSVASNTYDLWVDGVLIGDNLSKAQLAADANIDSWTFYGESSTSNVANIYVDGIEYSNTIASAPLPISLVKFEATKLAEKVKISWATATEVNNDKFIIERSADGENFERVTEVRGAGNSRELNAYEVVDANPLKGTSYYRLTQYDFNGEFETFAPVAVSMERGGLSVEHVAGSVEQGAESMGLRVFSPLASNATISVRDLSGRTIYSEKIMLQEGYQNFNLATTNFGAGIYLVSLNSGTEVVMKKVKL